jgi:hypothetical protein
MRPKQSRKYAKKLRKACFVWKWIVVFVRENIVAKDQGKRVKMTVTGLRERYRKWKVKVGEKMVERTRGAKLEENGFMGGHGSMKP